jgi:hypothetical protein
MAEQGSKDGEKVDALSANECIVHKITKKERCLC